MKALLPVFALLALASDATAQSVDTLPTREYCLSHPLPLLCLILNAGQQPLKLCAQIGQTSQKPAGQQCEGGAGSARERQGQGH